MKTAPGVTAEVIKNKMCYFKAGLMGVAGQKALSCSEYINVKIIAGYRLLSIPINCYRYLLIDNNR